MRNFRKTICRLLLMAAMVFFLPAGWTRVWAEPKNRRGFGIIERLSESRVGGGGFFFSHSPRLLSLKTPRDAINTDSSSGPFDTFAFEGPGRESSLYVVRINSLYTQTINSSMDLPAP